MQVPENRIYYFGDLDYEGIGIYERLEEIFEKQQHHIQPFAQAYEKMLEKAAQTAGLPVTKEKQNRRLSGRFFACFSQQTVLRMKDVLEREQYIPQEILNIADFRQ